MKTDEIQPSARIRVPGRTLVHAIALAILIWGFAVSLSPLGDPDLWWHLKLGQWTVDTGELVREDPFSFTSPVPISGHAKVILTGEWLGEVMLYLGYLAGGYRGVSVLVALILAAPFVLIYVIAFRRERVPPWFSLLSLVLPLFVLAVYMKGSYQRPQGVSFGMALILLMLMVRVCADSRNIKAYSIAIALLMALWANIHGGYIFGVLLMAAFGSGIVLQWTIKRDRGTLSRLIPLASGFAGSLMNPNAADTLIFIKKFFLNFIGAGETGWTSIVNVTLEYQSIWFAYKTFHFDYLLYVAGYYLIAGSAVLWSSLRSRPPRFPELMAMATALAFGTAYIRGIPFALLILAYLLIRAAQHMNRRTLRVFALLLACLSLFSLADTWRSSPERIRPGTPVSWVSPGQPESSVRFIVGKGLRGNMLNKFSWGGYFLWRMGPEIKVFVDGRTLDLGVVETYLSLVRAEDGWRNTLRDYDIQIASNEIFSERIGLPTPLLLRLLDEGRDEWALVFMEGNQAIFVRRDGANRELAERASMDAGGYYMGIFNRAMQRNAAMPGDPNAGLSIGIALYGLGRYQEARQYLLTLPQSTERDRYLIKISDTLQKAGR